MSRAHQPGALRRLAVAAMLAAAVGVLHAPAATAVTEAGTTTAAAPRSDESTASDDAKAGRDTATEARSRRDADRREEAGRRDSRDADSHDEDGTAGTSGDTDDAQPLSTADENEGGANGGCPEGEYCSTRDGSASENGAGDGEATGKPCAGCVGKADNKNPQGQMPNADEDGNRGYECDDNQGVGQGNPAHTGCVSETGSDGTGGGAGEDAGDDAGEDAAGDADVAGEDTLLGEPGAGVAGEAEVAGVEALVTRPGQGAGSAAVPAAAGPLAAMLPATGSGALVGLAAVAGLLLLGAGTVLLRRRAHG